MDHEAGCRPLPPCKVGEMLEGVPVQHEYVQSGLHLRAGHIRLGDQGIDGPSPPHLASGCRRRRSLQERALATVEDEVQPDARRGGEGPSMP